MTSLSVTATLASTKEKITLKGLSALELSSTLDSPADSLRAAFIADSLPGELLDISVSDGQDIMFTGKIDRQESELSSRGYLVEIEARSKGALLLDNEAKPITLWGANLRTMFERHIAPYGFVCYNPNPSRTLAVYTVGKGISEWEAFCGFTRRMHGITPYVIKEQVMVENPRCNAAIVISNSGEGLNFCSLRHIHKPYELISKVILRDLEGNYSTSVSNSMAAHYGVSRKRYVVPGGEFADNPGLDANQRISRSLRGMTQLVVRLPGITAIKAGQFASVDDVAITMRNLIVRERKYITGETGEFTELVLASSVYK